MCARCGHAGLIKKNTQQIDYVPQIHVYYYVFTRRALYYKNQEKLQKTCDI